MELVTHRDPRFTSAFFRRLTEQWGVLICIEFGVAEAHLMVEQKRFKNVYVCNHACWLRGDGITPEQEIVLLVAVALVYTVLD